MAKLRVYRSSVTSTTSGSLQVYEGSVSGDIAVAPKLRVFRSVVSGAPVPLLQPLDDRTVEPSTQVTYTVSLAPGSVQPDSYTWRVVSGEGVLLEPSGSSVTFKAPGLLDGAMTVIGVRATKDGVQSVERQATVRSRSQIAWAAVDGVWVPTLFKTL